MSCAAMAILSAATRVLVNTSACDWCGWFACSAIATKPKINKPTRSAAASACSSLRMRRGSDAFSKIFAQSFDGGIDLAAAISCANSFIVCTAVPRHGDGPGPRHDDGPVPRHDDGPGPRHDDGPGPRHDDGPGPCHDDGPVPRRSIANWVGLCASMRRGTACHLRWSRGSPRGSTSIGPLPRRFTALRTSFPCGSASTGMMRAKSLASGKAKTRHAFDVVGLRKHVVAFDRLKNVAARNQILQVARQRVGVARHIDKVGGPEF